jgi:hypothetical protein
MRREGIISIIIILIIIVIISPPSPSPLSARNLQSYSTPTATAEASQPFMRSPTNISGISLSPSLSFSLLTLFSPATPLLLNFVVSLFHFYISFHFVTNSVFFFPQRSQSPTKMQCCTARARRRTNGCRRKTSRACARRTQ